MKKKQMYGEIVHSRRPGHGYGKESFGKKLNIL